MESRRRDDSTTHRSGQPPARTAVRRPRGLTRLMHRYPLILYSLNLGFLVGRRYLRLTHIGRRTGRRRHTVLYVFHFDDQTNERYVGAVYGSESDWYRNILETAAVEVRVGRRTFVPEQRLVDADEAARLIARWRLERPRYARMSERMRGASFDDVIVPVVAFRDPDPG